MTKRSASSNQENIKSIYDAVNTPIIPWSLKKNPNNSSRLVRFSFPALITVQGSDPDEHSKAITLIS